MEIQPQKSEVHESTDDASSSPVSRRSGKESLPSASSEVSSGGGKVDPDMKGRNIEVVRDETDNGGPLVVKSDDPEMKSLELPVDPFPTDRKPEIDPPVK